MPGYEHHAVVIGVVERKLDVMLTKLQKTLQRVADFQGASQGVGQLEGIGIHHCPDQRFFVAEIQIQARSGIAYPLSNGAHGDGFHPLVDKQLTRGINDPCPDRLFLAVCFDFRGHATSLKVNITVLS
jgi:hypothetical protein